MNEYIFSPDLLFESFQSVKENQGCAGVDGVSIMQFEERLETHLKKQEDELADGTYLPLPLLKIHMVPFDRPKKEHKILFFPPPFNLNAYLLKKKKGW